MKRFLIRNDKKPRQDRRSVEHSKSPGRPPSGPSHGSSSSRPTYNVSDTAVGLDVSTASHVEADDDRSGLRTLWPPDKTGSTPISETTVHIVAVHGLNGDLYKTWQDEDTGWLWLRDFLPDILPRAHITTFGYNSAVAFSASVSRIEDFAVALLVELTRVRRRYKTQKTPLVFVCHSLGGIVFKKALIIAHERTSVYGELLKRIKGVLFLGTPHRGSDTAYWGTMLSRMANMGLPGSIRTDLLKDLRSKATVLGDICTQFVERAVPLQIVTGYEQLRMPGLNHVITAKDSAILHLPNEVLIPVEADHVRMCKFRSAASNTYEIVSDQVLQLAEVAAGIPQQIHSNIQSKILRRLRDARLDHEGVVSLIARPHTDTCRWITAHPEFLRWRDTATCRILWMYGPPGIGKTVATRFVYEKLKIQSGIGIDQTTAISEPSVIPTAFFFSRQDPLRRTEEAFIREIVCQLLSADYNLVTHVDKQYREDKETMNTAACYAFLEQLLKYKPGPLVRIVIDGLDEADDDQRDSIARAVFDLAGNDKHSRLRIFISDRRPPLATMNKRFSAPGVAILELEAGDVSTGVDAFIASEIEHFASEHSFESDVTREIVETIANVADGAFLHAKLAIANFKGRVKLWTNAIARRQLELIRHLTPTLQSFYCGLLSLIPDDFVDQAKMLFAIVRAAHIPLSVEQLCYAMTIDGSQMSLAEVAADLPFNFHEAIQEFCGYLLYDYGHSVRFSHKSAMDLFVEDVQVTENAEVLLRFRTSGQECHRTLARFCLRVLRFSDFQFPRIARLFGSVGQLSTSGYDESLADCVLYTEEWRGLRRAHRDIFEYALLYWDRHVTIATFDDRLLDMIANWMRSPGAAYCHTLRRQRQESSIIIRFDPSLIFRVKDPILRNLEDGHFAYHLAIAYRQNSGVFDRLCAAGYDSNYYAEGYGTPLFYAVAQADETSMDYLLNMESVLTSLPDVGEQAAGYAVGRLLMPATALVHRLLWHRRKSIEGPERIYEFTIRQFFRGSAGSQVWELLLSACDWHYPGIAAFDVGLLVEALRRSNRWDERYALDLLKRDLLFDDAHYPHEVAEVLMGCEVADWRETENIMLLRYSRYIASSSVLEGFSLITRYAYLGRRKQVLKYLQAVPRELRSLINTGPWNLASLCAHQDWQDVVMLLWNEYGIACSPSDHEQRSVLHWAVENQWDLTGDFEQLVPDFLDSQDRDGKTALHLASETGNVPAARWLLDRHASFLIRDKEGKNAVHAAAEFYCRKIIDMFLEQEVREFGRDYEGQTFLHLLVRWSDEDYVCRAVRRKKLLINLRDRKGRTVLHHAAAFSNASSALAVLSFGATVSPVDCYGRTPLHYAVCNKNLYLVDLLTKHGAKLSIRNRFGQSCTQMAIRTGDLTMATKFLLSPARRRKDFTTVDAFGATVLHDLCRHIDYILHSSSQITDSETVDRNAKRDSQIRKEPERIVDTASTLFQAIYSDEADLDLQDVRGRTPRQILAMSGPLRIAHTAPTIRLELQNELDNSEEDLSALDMALVRTRPVDT